MKVRFTKSAGKYIQAYPSQGEPHGNMKPHQWQDKNNNKYERVYLNVTGLTGEVDCGFGITDKDPETGKRYCFPVRKKDYEEIA